MRVPVIGDLVQERQRLEIYCAGYDCPRRGAAVVLDPEDAIKLLGATTTFPQARERLRCRECGATGGKSITVRASITDYYNNLRAHGLSMPDPAAERGS